MTQMRHLPATLVAVVFPLLAHGAADGGIRVRGEQVLPSDIAALPPVCRLLMENDGIHHFTGQKRNKELFERPEYHMAKGNGHLHHYCWALIAKQRYFREPRQSKREFYFNRYIGDINYVFEHSSKNWGYFDVLHIELASMYLIRRDYAKAISHADQALASKPRSEKAYMVKADAYYQMGKKDLAVETALEGLKKSPHSKIIRNWLAKLGETPPTPEEVAAQEQAEGPSAGSTATRGTGSSAASAAAGGETSPADTDPAASIPATATDQARNAPPATASPESSTPNPYCRFCP